MVETDTQALELEVELLRARVADLQRKVGQFVAGGEVRDVHGVAVSIAEREAVLVEAERLTHTGSWVWNIETNEVTWSDELYRILGLDPSRDVASVGSFFDAVHPDDRVRVRSLSAAAMETGVAPRVEHRVLRPDGMVRHVLTDGAVLFDENGRVRRIVGTIHDTTDARSARRKLERAHALLEEAQALGHMGSFVFNTEHGTVEWSSEFCRILGVPPGTPGSAELFFSRLHPEDVPRLRALHASLMERLEPILTDARIVQVGGDIRYVRLAGSPRYSEEEERFSELHGTILDLTDLRRLQERLVQAEKMEAVGRLAGGIAHDFNNLLMVVRGNLELLGAGGRPELRAIMTAVESAQTLTAGLLAFGRKSLLQRQVIDLNGLVTQTVTLLHRLIGEHITLRSELDPELPRVEVDLSLVQQALINLVINARDVLTQGGTITVRTSAAEEDGEHFAELEVEDDGPGIGEAERTRIFEPFFTTKQDGRGSGLGLAMVHGTVTQHGGSVRVASEPGHGSRFTLRLPGINTSISAPPSALPGTFAAPAGPPQGHTILVVEDDVAVATVLVAMLTHSGYTALVVQRPSEALALAAATPDLDLVLCDLMMPEMHGVDLGAQLRSAHPQLRILFMSGYSGDHAQLPAGTQLLGKPFSMAALNTALLSVLSEPRAE